MSASGAHFIYQAASDRRLHFFGVSSLKVNELLDKYARTLDSE